MRTTRCAVPTTADAAGAGAGATVGPIDDVRDGSVSCRAVAASGTTTSPVATATGGQAAHPSPTTPSTRCAATRATTVAATRPVTDAGSTAAIARSLAAISDATAASSGP